MSQENSLRSRHDDGDKTDRYGKKYSWTAFFELAGFRQDLGLLGEVSEEQRLHNVNIDPSFPDEVPTFELINYPAASGWGIGLLKQLELLDM